jgi:pantoate--beta-alanine ligase
MKIFTKVKDLKTYLKSQNGSIGFVPTMGALHAGHLSLIKTSKSQNDLTVVSIFVNPTQFLKGEDLDKYPRKDEADKKICDVAGVDVLFFPSVDEIYKDDEAFIQAPLVRGYILEGASRPGHFSGVLTVVMKLLHMVNPTRAYFGKKDAQQLFLIQEMVKNFFLDVEIVPVDTVREADGLALSSRNVYLSKEQRKEALKISASLNLARSLVTKGIYDTSTIKAKMLEVLKPLRVEYVEILSRDFNYIKEVKVGESIVLVEAIVGTTRLLDNIWL